MGFLRSALASSVLAIGCVLSSHSLANITGAEFVEANKSFSQGYAWGVLDHELAQFTSDTKPRRARKLKLAACLVAKPVSAELLDSLVRTHIDANPQRSAEPALRSVLNVLAGICNYNR